jgi:hypothetical protein
MSKNAARKMVSRFPGVCPHCNLKFEAGTEIVYVPDSRPGTKGRHVDCQRAYVLPNKIFAAGLKSIQDDFNEMYWRGIEQRWQTELEGLRAQIAARTAAAQTAAAGDAA